MAVKETKIKSLSAKRTIEREGEGSVSENPIYGRTCQLVMGRFVFRESHFNEIIPQFYRLKRIQNRFEILI